MITILLTAVCTYTLFFALHWIPFKIWAIRQRTRTMTLMLILCLPSAFLFFDFFQDAIPIEINHAPLSGTAFAVALFTLLWCGYVQFVFSFDTSPSLRVLVEFLRHPNGMSRKEITDLMTFPATFRRRFLRASTNDAVVIHRADGTEERYSNTPTGTRFAKFGTWAKEFFRLGAGG